MTRRGWYLAFEGGEGRGKSTQVDRLAAALGPATIVTREPGATTVGAAVRSLLLDPETGAVDPTAEALLMAADRAQHAADVLDPALRAGRTVVSDRSAYSSLAYQGYGRGLDLATIRAVSDWALRGRWPDLVVLLDFTDGRPAGAGGHASAVLDDRFERQSVDFHERVLSGFRALAASEPERWLVVDAGAPIEVVAAAVLDGVRTRCPGLDAEGDAR